MPLTMDAQAFEDIVGETFCRHLRDSQKELAKEPDEEWRQPELPLRPVEPAPLAEIVAKIFGAKVVAVREKT